MKRTGPWFLLVIAFFAPRAIAATTAGPAADTAAVELKQQLDQVSLDPDRAYDVHDLRLRRDTVRVIFDSGRLVFLRPVVGQVTGALFVGDGSILVMPRQKIERAQLARFTGAPILEERFSSAFLRFTDTTFGEVLEAIDRGAGQPLRDADLLTRWGPVVRNLNPQYTMRILADLLIQHPRPIFALSVAGSRLGQIDIRVDERLTEQITIGQTHWTGGQPLYDMWCSFSRRSADPARTPLATFRPVRYRIETRIQPSHVLEGETEIEMAAQVGGERVFSLDLARQLQVKSVTDSDGHPLLWFADGSGTGNEAQGRSSDLLILVLPEATEEGRHYRVRLRYVGAVIYDVGNGVLYVGARSSWYPNLGMSVHADYEMVFHYPRPLVLVATGRKESETTQGDWRIARWVSAGPLTVVGFNLGEYDVRQLEVSNISVAVYANRQLERALEPQPLASLPPPVAPGTRPRPMIELPRPPSSANPAAAADVLARQALDAIHFFESYFGPFPYPGLAISQVPGNFGQGWPGLLYLSTFSFLRPDEQARVGLSARSREFFTDLVPFHETAHQWWGNLVSWEDYHDQWVSESLSTYAGLLYLERRRNDSRGMQNWLRKYKEDLLGRGPDDRLVDQTGPLWLGKRLISSENPSAYEKIIYAKGAWVMHMLRQLFREPAKAGGASDERFRQALREFAATYSHRVATSDDLRHAFEKHMPPQLDLDEDGTLEWFFEEWVKDTGIPRYKLESNVKADGPRFQVRGKIFQKDVPEQFVMPVPVFGQSPQGKLVLLGRVVVRGSETPFRFTLPWKPSRVVLDPFNTILAVVE